MSNTKTLREFSSGDPRISQEREVRAPGLLSVVVIARNEARNIAKCIESTLAGTRCFPDTQVLLVDSASEDDTVAIAQTYPISVVELKPTWRLTPAAGRFIGTLRTTSEYILFLDGDMLLKAGWIEAGIEFLRAHPEAAAVSGDLSEIYLDEHGNIVGLLPSRYKVRSLTCTRALGGAGLYRRLALDQAGTFNPFVPLREEAELGLRLRRAGYQLYRIPISIADHFSAPRQTLREIRRRYHAGYYAGFGRALHYSLRAGLGWQFVREQALSYIGFAIYSLVGFASLLAYLLAGYWQLFAVWSMFSVVVFTAFALTKGSLTNTSLGLLSRALTAFCGIVGWVSALRDPSEYPTDVVVVRR